LVGQKTGHRDRSGRQGQNGPALTPSPEDHEVRSERAAADERRGVKAVLIKERTK
jgi:hypothetical protein